MNILAVEGSPNLPKRTIPRYRPKQDAEPTQKPEPAFVILPRAVLLRPPIRHRGDRAEAGLSVFEFAVAGGCIQAAMLAAANHRHAKALRAGQRAIRRQREALTPASLHRTKEHGLNVGRDVIGGAGSSAYWIARYDDRTDTEVEISQRGLLRFAGASRNERSAAGLELALKRLTRPIGKLPPVLRRYDLGAKVRFVVRADWLPSQRFAKVPWPPPMQGGGATAAALWLIAHGVDDRQDPPPMRANTLVARLGLRQRRPAHVQRAIAAALVTVNRHAQALGVDEFAIVPSRGGDFVRIIRAGTMKYAAHVDNGGELPRQELDGPTADEIEERREAGRRARAQERATETAAGLGRLAENLARLRA